MAFEDRFKQSVISRLAKRAANRCSNPDCGAITSGPADSSDGAINVGEAAHIYGANPGSARYEAGMLPSERSAITNAIWLCSNCHKIVDDDPNKYPVGLLFEWQREHEYLISRQVGKASAEAKERYQNRHLEEFGRLSYLAERLILEKDDYWEFRLTAEVLRYETGPVLRRWAALKRGLYFRSIERVEGHHFSGWLATKNSELLAITHAFSELVNVEFARAWGDPGVPGSDVEIVAACRLFREMCQGALEWEERVRFIEVEDVYDEVRSLYVGVAGNILEEASKVPEFLGEKVGGEPVLGQHTLRLKLELPEGWNDAVSVAVDRAIRRIKAR